MKLETRLNSLLNIHYPVMSAPMSMHSGATLAAAVTHAGGLGMFGAIGSGGEDWLQTELVKANNLLGDKPFGIGFITHLMDSMPGLFEIALEAQVSVMAFSFADPGPYIHRAKEAGATTVCQIRNMDQAAEAVAAGADILVAQGNESGGHTGEANLMPLLNRVLDAHPDIPVLAAGGISCGRALAAVIAAGADGAWIGTPLLATPECVEVSMAYKQRLIDASAEDTLYTPLFDVANHQAYHGTPWPSGIAARVIANDFTAEWNNKINEVTSSNTSLMEYYKEQIKNKNLDVSVVYAGESVQDIHQIQPAEDIIRSICDDAQARLK
ncbi:MAG: nitronate monooxygenase [Pseudomonadales bacterium]